MATLAGLVLALFFMVAPRANAQAIHFKDFQLLSAPSPIDLMLIDSFASGVYHTKVIDYNTLASNIMNGALQMIVTNTATNSTFNYSNLFNDPPAQNWFATNFDAYITDYFLNHTFFTNTYMPTIYASNIINLDAYVSNVFNTNVYVSYPSISNYFATNIFETVLATSNFYTTTITTKNLHVQNIFAQSAFFTNNILRLTNLWTYGPTGAVDLWFGRQRFRASTPCYISGFLSRTNFATSEVLLSIDNISATNIWVTLTNGFRFSGTLTNTAVVTNGTTLKLWLEYDPSGANSVGESNAVPRQFSFP